MNFASDVHQLDPLPNMLPSLYCDIVPVYITHFPKAESVRGTRVCPTIHYDRRANGLECLANFSTEFMVTDTTPVGRLRVCNGVVIWRGEREGGRGMREGGKGRERRG